MNPRKLGAWLGRLLVSAGIVAAVFLGAQGTAQASDAAAVDSDSISTMTDPTWG